MNYPNLITFLMVYLSIGASLWALLDGAGVVQTRFAAAPLRSRSLAMVLATLMMIGSWPVFVHRWVKGMLE